MLDCFLNLKYDKIFVFFFLGGEGGNCVLELRNIDDIKNMIGKVGNY